MKKVFCLIVLAAVCMSAFSCVQKIQPASTVTGEATEGYESVTISDGNTRKTEFEVTMKKQ
ncbi:MAG: hypothetical protein II135_01880 [Clostridia bacterium]|nr:hypothetical protein [Clostridia bacterium]